VRRSTTTKVLASLAALAIVAAACGDDDDSTAVTTAAGGGAATTSAATGSSAATTSAGSTESTAASSTESSTAGSGSTAGSAGGGNETSGTIAKGGDGSKDLGAFKLGVINSNDLFPEYSQAIDAAVKYANAELNGFEGRQVEVQTCTIDYNTPDDTQRCANELAAAKVDFAVSTLNQFGTHMQILRGAGIPVLVGTAVSVPDYTTDGVYAVLPGGGCAGTLTGMVKYAAEELKAKKIAVPYYDIPSGVLCYADSEQKPIDVLKGTVEGAKSPDAGKYPDLEREGFAVPPTDPDLTSIANQILAYKPDAIIFSGPSTSCFPLLAALNQVGYSISDIPFVMTQSCFDEASAKDAGDNAKGLYFVGSSAYLSSDPSTLTGKKADEAKLYQEQGAKNGIESANLSKGFAQAGFSLIMSMVQRSAEVAKSGGKVDGKTLADAFAKTKDAPEFGGTPISCSEAPKPYVTLCNTHVAVTKWDGSAQQPVIDDYYAADLVEGTPIRTEPLQ
jgi:branched-chain amino acid transport system substrate-binding protein